MEKIFDSLLPLLQSVWTSLNEENMNAESGIVSDDLWLVGDLCIKIEMYITGQDSTIYPMNVSLFCKFWVDFHI